MERIKACFVVNPISGGKSKEKIFSLINSELASFGFDLEVMHTQYVGHAEEIAKRAVIEQFDVVVAVGGDGTINEVARNLIGTQVKLAIIPFGSGNGLARFLNIPLHPRKALLVIKDMFSIKIDAGTFNSSLFFNMAGVGLDAKISHVFSNTKHRGFRNYLKLAFEELKKWKPVRYKLKIDGKEIIADAYMISIANSSQYGNNVHIATDASVTDGLLDVCIVRPFPKILLPYYGVKMLAKKVHGSKHLTVIKGAEITIQQEGFFYAHTDGEPIIGEGAINIKVCPLSLNVIVPKNKI